MPKTRDRRRRKPPRTPEQQRWFDTLIWRKGQIAAFRNAVHDEYDRRRRELGAGYMTEEDRDDLERRVIASGHARPPQAWFDEFYEVHRALIRLHSTRLSLTAVSLTDGACAVAARPSLGHIGACPIPRHPNSCTISSPPR